MADWRANHPTRKTGSASMTIWMASCLLHALLLWGLSTMSMARGTGRGAEAAGLSIEGRFLGATGDGQWDSDSEGSELALSEPEFRLTSTAPTAVESTDAPDEPAIPDEAADEPDSRDVPRSLRHLPRHSPDSSTVESESHAGRRRSPFGAMEGSSGRTGRRPGRGAGAGSSGSMGSGGGTTFFDVAGHGTKFVYVIDRSDSMLHKHRLSAARNELLASLRDLSETGLVQVLFYNNDIVSLDVGGRGGLLRNSSAQQRKLAQFASGIQPDGGTDHLRALQAALQFTPDAIFLLTDADEPKLHAADLDRLQRLNRRRVPIHAVELGVGPLLESDNFLMRLARQSQGTYRYWDIEDLSGSSQFGEAPLRDGRAPRR